MSKTLDFAHESFPFFDYPFSQEIWQSKYSNNGKDKDILATFHRVANAVAKVEADPTLRTKYGSLFFNYMRTGILVPAGRILAGAGTDNRVTLVNCFVNETVHDSMEGIMKALANTALTMQQGGGMGTDFSTIRPSGALLKRTGSEASGPLPFMDTWDAMCRTIMSAGSRRGAMMGTICDTHPDLLQFIEAKTKSDRLKMFNVSVLVSDAFMHAVEADRTWPLYFHEPPLGYKEGDPTFTDRNGVKQYIYSEYMARDIWDRIMKTTFEYAEPGVIFIDRVNKMNNLYYVEDIRCTNPCGEQPLPPHGACNLGAINVARLVEKPFTKRARFNWVLFQESVTTAMRFLDNVIDATRYPLVEQRREQINKRRTGLGITGLADAMIQLDLKYGSPEAVEFAREVAKVLANAAYTASARLAAEKGAAPAYVKEDFEKSSFLKVLGDIPRNLIQEHGLRNCVLLTLAPTGTTSIAYGNISSSLEPNFLFQYNRKVLEKDGTLSEHKVESFITRFAKHCNVEPEGDVWVTTKDLTVNDHLNTQAAMQQFIDASISKTINCSPSITFEQFKDVYHIAWKKGCKGCTTYRPSDVRGSVLSEDTSSEPEIKPEVNTRRVVEAEVTMKVVKTPRPSTVNVHEDKRPLERPDRLDGATYKLKWPAMSSAIYMTINSSSDGQPFEVFFASKDCRYQDWTTALSLTLTSLFRLNINPTFILEEFQQITGMNESAWIDGQRFDSFIAYVGYILNNHINGSPAEAPTRTEKQPAEDPCVKCNSRNTKMESGCLTCLECGYSKCG